MHCLSLQSDNRIDHNLQVTFSHSRSEWTWVLGGFICRSDRVGSGWVTKCFTFGGYGRVRQQTAAYSSTNKTVITIVVIVNGGI